MSSASPGNEADHAGERAPLPRPVAARAEAAEAADAASPSACAPDAPSAMMMLAALAALGAREDTDPITFQRNAIAARLRPDERQQLRDDIGP